MLWLVLSASNMNSTNARASLKHSTSTQFRFFRQLSQVLLHSSTLKSISPRYYNCIFRRQVKRSSQYRIMLESCFMQKLLLSWLEIQFFSIRFCSDILSDLRQNKIHFASSPSLPARPLSWQRVVDHESHIRFVDAHPKSNSCYNYLDIVPHPHLLDLPLLMIVDVRVVKRHFVIAIPQFLAYLLTLFPREAVDNASLSSELGLFQYPEDLIHGILLLGSDFIVEVGPVERGLEIQAPLYLQSFDDILLNNFSHSGGQTQDGSVGEALPQNRQILIVLPEFLAPSGHAVDLIDYNFHQMVVLVDSFQDAEELGRLAHFLRCAEDNETVTPCLIIQHLLVYLFVFLLLFGPSQAQSLNPHTLGLELLVDDERYERQDAEIDPFLDECHRLECQTLAASCRHAHKHIIAQKRALYNSFLIVFVVLDARELPQYKLQLVVFYLSVALPLLSLPNLVVIRNGRAFRQTTQCPQPRILNCELHPVMESHIDSTILLFTLVLLLNLFSFLKQVGVGHIFSHRILINSRFGF